MKLEKFLKDHYAYSDDLMYAVVAKCGSYAKTVWTGRTFRNIPQVFLDWKFDRICFDLENIDTHNPTVWLFVNPPKKYDKNGPTKKSQKLHTV